MSDPILPGMLYDLDASPPHRRPYTRLEKALFSEAHRVEAILAEALGFTVYPPGSPGYSPEEVTYATGDHTTVSLALTAQRRIAELADRLADAT